MTNNFKNIVAWQIAHEFVLSVYETTKKFPATEAFGLTSQIQRAAVSIPANIAEGYRKLGKADKLRFLNIAQGSVEECRYYIILATDLKYITAEDAKSLQVLIEKTSWYLNSYCKGIITNNGVKDDIQP